MQTITFTIKDEYAPRIQDAFQKMTGMSAKDAIIEHVKGVVQESEMNDARVAAEQGVVIPGDLIEYE